MTRDLVKREGLWWLLRLTGKGIGDALRGMLGMRPLLVSTVGPPGAMAAITTPGADASYRALAGPDWVDGVCARVLLTGAAFRPVQHAARIPCPILLQVGDRDFVVPNDATEQVAKLAGQRATVLHYPFDHFEGYRGDAFERVVDDQIVFLQRHLSYPTERSARSPGSPRVPSAID